MLKYISGFLYVLFVCSVMLPFSPLLDTHWPKWFAFHLVLGGLMSLYYGRKYHWSVGILIATTLFSGFRAFSNRFTYQDLNLVQIVDIYGHTAQGVLAFILCIFLADVLSEKSCAGILKAFIAVCTAHCLYVLAQFYFLGKTITEATGFLPNVSMGPSMLVMLLPLMFYGAVNSKRWLRWSYTASSILYVYILYIHQSSISYAALIASIAALSFCVISFAYSKSKALITAMVLVLIMVPLGMFFDKEWAHFTQINRFEYWPMFWKWWVEADSLWFGIGTGSFRHFGPAIQMMNKKGEGAWWLWAHNDILQIIFETGILGLVSSACLFGTCVYRAYRFLRFDLVASLIAMLVVMAGNYPLHLAEYCVLVTILLTSAMKLNTDCLE